MKFIAHKYSWEDKEKKKILFTFLNSHSLGYIWLKVMRMMTHFKSFYKNVIRKIFFKENRNRAF